MSGASSRLAWCEMRKVVSSSPLPMPTVPDWPDTVQVCGFLDMPNIDVEGAVAPALAGFIAAGEAPVYMTLGSWTPGDTDEQRATLLKLTERYCVVLQTLVSSPHTDVTVTMRCHRSFSARAVATERVGRSVRRSSHDDAQGPIGRLRGRDRCRLRDRGRPAVRTTASTGATHDRRAVPGYAIQRATSVCNLAPTRGCRGDADPQHSAASPPRGGTASNPAARAFSRRASQPARHPLSCPRCRSRATGTSRAI
mgnify:CR=1 FL=1